MVKKMQFEKIAEYMFLLLLMVVGADIIYFNLSDIRCSLDPDFACTIYHYMEVIKNGTMQLPDWFHTTSLELDGTMLFALPLYFVTRNIFTAIGISNILIMILYVAVIWRLLHLYKLDRMFIYLTLILVLTPYEYGMLDYFNMMFYGGACYAIKTIVPLLLLLLLKLIGRKNYIYKTGDKVEMLVWGILYIVLLFGTAFSTGTFVVLCGLLPILVWMILEVFLKGKPDYLYDKKVWLTWLVTAGTFLLGYALHNKVYQGISRTNMNLTNMGEFADNFKACIRGVYELLGAITLENVPVLSIEGIIFCVKIVFVSAFIVAVFFHYFKFTNENIVYGNNKINLKNYVAFMFVWTFMVMFLADMRYSGNNYTEYRYFIIGIVPLMILFGIQLQCLDKLFNDFQRKMAYVTLFLACVILIYGNHKNVKEEWDRSTYAVEVTEYVESLNVESLIFVNDRDSAMICKGIDSNHKYGAFMTDSQTMYLGICSYYASGQGVFYGNRHAMALIEGNDIYQCLPEQIARSYTKVGKIRWFDIYVSDVMLIP